MAVTGATHTEAEALGRAGVSTGDNLLASAGSLPGLAARSGLSLSRLEQLVAAVAEGSVEQIARPVRTHVMGVVRAAGFVTILALAGVAILAIARPMYAAPPSDNSALARAIAGRLILTVKLATAPVSVAATPFTSTLYASPKEPNLSSAQAFPDVNVLAVQTDNNVTVASVAVDRATADAIAGAAAASEFYLTWPAPEIK